MTVWCVCGKNDMYYLNRVGLVNCFLDCMRGEWRRVSGESSSDVSYCLPRRYEGKRKSLLLQYGNLDKNQMVGLI